MGVRDFRLSGLTLSRRAATMLILGASLLITLFYAFSHGQDTNWDQRNYHLVVPHLLLHGGFWDSVQPAGFQTYLNPLPLIPAYLAIMTMPPLLATAVIALVQSAAFMVAGLICLRLERNSADRGLAALGFLLCLASPMALSEAGSTFVDLWVSVPILLAYWLLLDGGRRGPRSVALAGLLLGVSAGMKLTAVLFLLGMPMLFATGPEPALARLRLLIICGLACLAGIMISGFWWHWHLWQTFGSPVFPLWNSIFHARDYWPEDYHDDRFTGKTAWDLLRYPIAWMIGGGGPAPGLLGPASETDPRDPRFLLIILGLSALAVAAMLNARVRGRFAQSPAAGLLLAWPVIYVAWLYLFGILRYMMPLEILGGAVLLGLVQFLPTMRLRQGVLIGAGVLSLVMMHTGFFGRMHFQGGWRTLAEHPPVVAPRAVVFLAEQPLAYVAASLPTDARFIATGGFGMSPEDRGTATWGKINALLDPSAGRPLYALGYKGHDVSADPTLVMLGLRVTAQCQHFAVAMDHLQLCELRPTPAPKTP